MRTEITRMLYVAGDYLSGEEISKKFNITRAAVWKHIKSLQEDGCKIDARTNRGYKLEKIPDLLKPQYVNLFLDASVKLIWLKSVDSTNNYAKTAARKGAPSGTVAITEHQTGGKGRMGRAWASKPGEAIQISMVRRPELEPQHAPGYNFAAALAVCRAVEDVCNVSTRIKWPNDVVIDGKKLCGILTEMSADMYSVEYIVCGVGVNANQRKFDAELADKAISLRLATGKKVDRARLAGILINELDRAFEEFEAGGISCLMDEYCQKSAVLGETVCVSDQQGDFTGKCTGFGERGELFVEGDRESRIFHAGDVSVRGIENYI